MHPLTIEDILSQETREKIESYEQLGYYFVAFRALDETYFKYSEDTASSLSSSTSKTSSTEGVSSKDDLSDDVKVVSSESSDMNGNGHSVGKSGKTSPEILEKSLASSSDDTRPEKAKRKKGIVEIVEGHKEGVEGAGVGAVNMYLVVFGDGIISVSEVF
jgi:magnesium transporter